MLVLAPAACIMSGIALSEAFAVFTRSIKFQLPGIAQISEINVSSLSYLAKTQFHVTWILIWSTIRY